MNKVILESPFAGNIERNIAYAKLCIRDILMHEEAPIASHLLFTQEGILNDNNPEERKLGISAGHAWMEVADYVCVYTDFGISSGMQKGIEKASECAKAVIYRNLSKNVIEKLIEMYPG